MTEIRTETFASRSLTGSNLSDVYTTSTINGHILKAVFDYNDTDSNGSVWLGVSGTVSEELIRINGFSADAVTYPRVIPVDKTNASLSGTAPFAVTQVCNAPLVLTGSGLQSGNTLGAITVYYEQR